MPITPIAHLSGLRDRYLLWRKFNYLNLWPKKRNVCKTCLSIKQPFDGTIDITRSSSPRFLVYWHDYGHNHFMKKTKSEWCAKLGYGFYLPDYSVAPSIRKKPEGFLRIRAVKGFPAFYKFGPRTVKLLNKRSQENLAKVYFVPPSDLEFHYATSMDFWRIKLSTHLIRFFGQLKNRNPSVRLYCSKCQNISHRFSGRYLMGPDIFPHHLLRWLESGHNHFLLKSKFDWLFRFGFGCISRLSPSEDLYNGENYPRNFKQYPSPDLIDRDLYGINSGLMMMRTYGSSINTLKELRDYLKSHTV